MTMIPVRRLGFQHGPTECSGNVESLKVSHSITPKANMIDTNCIGPLPSDWSEGDLVHYGRADLTQSDHRPVIAVLDVQARVVDKMKRKEVISDIVSSLGPSDGTVISTPCIGSSAVSLSAIGGSLEEVVGSINSKFSNFFKQSSLKLFSQAR